MGQKKVNRTEELKQKLKKKVFLAEVPDLLFGNCKIYIAVSALSGIDPPMMATAFKEHVNELRKKALEPSPREMLELSLNEL